MKLRDIKDLLNCKDYSIDSLLERDVIFVYSADMMSDVLKSCKAGSVLLTGLINIQVVKVAEIMDLIGIVFLSGKEPTEDMINKAIENKLPLLVTQMNMYDASGILYKAGFRSS